MKIRYLVETGILTGWKNDLLESRGPFEKVVELSLLPDADDYEYYKYNSDIGKLVHSGKQKPTLAPPERNLATELDALKTRVESLELKKEV